MFRFRLKWLVVIACAILVAGCSGGGPGLISDDPANDPGSVLPSLAELAGAPDTPTRAVSDNQYDVLSVAPVFSSPNDSAVYSGGELTLDPTLNGGMAWAICAVTGLATDGSEYPTGLAVSKSANPVWIGSSDYTKGYWEFLQCLGSGGLALTGGTGLMSGGTTYVALVAVDDAVGDADAVTIDGLTLTTCCEIPGGDFRELLIIYNSDIPEDLALANYYGSSVTGRGIDPEYRLGLALGAGQGQSISRADYGSLIRDPLIAFLNANPTIKGNIKYLLLMKGVPHQIEGYEDLNGNDGVTTMCSALDNELCVLNSGGVVDGAGNYPIIGWLWNGVEYMQPPVDARTFFESDCAFTPHYFKVSDASSNLYDLDYLVGRITGYTYEEARATIDRSLAADTSGTGWTIFDSSNEHISGYPMNYLDTMVDPVYPYGVDTKDCGYELLTAAGFNVFADITSTHILSTTAGLPAGAASNVIAYCSWGQHAGMNPEYILNDLGFTYRPGACFMSYESFNAATFDDSSGIQRRGQGQVADFLRMGGTVGIGNAWEPFDRGIGDERWAFDRYLHHGDRWIEAAYQGLRLLSWQEVVVGDPLCRVVAP